MITRRGFLQAMFAAAAAPYVMSGGVASGILMPVRTLIVPPPCAIELFAADGTLLSKIVYSMSDIVSGPRKSDPFGFIDAFPAGRGLVERTGTFHEARLHHPKYGVVPIDLRLASRALIVGSDISLMPLHLQLS